MCPVSSKLLKLKKTALSLFDSSLCILLGIPAHFVSLSYPTCFSLVSAETMMVITPLALVALLAGLVAGQEEGEGLVGSYKIEGKVTPPDVKPANWLTVTTVTLDGGKRRAFLKEDNSFVFQGVTSGTFLVEVENPDYMYEQVNRRMWCITGDKLTNSPR